MTSQLKHAELKGCLVLAHATSVQPSFSPHSLCKIFNEPMKLLRQARAASLELSCPDLVTASPITLAHNSLQKHKKKDATSWRTVSRRREWSHCSPLHARIAMDLNDDGRTRKSIRVWVSAQYPCALAVVRLIGALRAQLNPMIRLRHRFLFLRLSMLQSPGTK